MSEDRLLSALNASMKESEKNFTNIESIKNEDYNSDEILRKKYNHA